VISKGQVISLPSYIQGRPIIIVTSLGNIFFLQPGSSIGPFATASRGGVEILTQIYTSSGPSSVSTNVTTNIYGTYKNFTTPIAFSNQTGTFVTRLPQYVFYQNSKGQIITGVFHNWIVLGLATVNSTSSQGIQVTLRGQPVVLIGNYTQITSTVGLTLQVKGDSNIYVSIFVNGNSYTIQNEQTITVPAGYVNITVITLQANDTTQQSQGVISHYSYSNAGYNGKTYVAKSFLIFVPPGATNPTVYLNYLNDYNYYLVKIIGNYSENTPGQVRLILNGTVYNYNNPNPYWIIGGNYSFDPTGIFTGSSTYGAQTVIFQYSNRTSFTYTFPNIPSYVIINQPMNITVNYAVTEYWQQL
jgi:hypothetical protein